MKEESKRQKVICAMSGGLDSSVAAALLRRAGFYPELGRRVEVIGVFMKFWKAPDDNGLIGGWNRCCSLEAEARARKVAKILKIPFYVIRFEKEFKKRIVDYFLKGCKEGITPNPCVVCNKEIKFGLLLEKALSLDAGFVATGHYARTNLFKNFTIVKNSPKIKLMIAKDKNKDQSYFLWKLNQKQLKHIVFPVGNYTRIEVEKLARKFRLPFRGVRKSQEICFIPKTINGFLKEHLKEKPGRIIDTRGEMIGEHEGLYFYTIGQRKGIGLPGGPYYVLDKDFKKNLLIVTKNEKDLYKKELIAKNVNWIPGKIPKLPLKVKVKIRYRHAFASAVITKILDSKFYILKFARPQRAITPGQSVVFYSSAEASAKAGEDQELLGGGIIC